MDWRLKSDLIGQLASGGDGGVVKSDELVQVETDNHVTDSDITSGMSLAKARSIDSVLSPENAISLTFLLSNADNLTPALKVAWEIEKTNKNYVMFDDNLAMSGGVVEIFFKSYMICKDNTFEARLKEALYYNSNHDVLKKMFSVDKQESKLVFRRPTHLSPTILYLYQVCSEALGEQAEEICQKAGLISHCYPDPKDERYSFKSLELKMMFTSISKRLSMEALLDLVITCLPGELREYLQQEELLPEGRDINHPPPLHTMPSEMQSYEKGKGYAVIFSHKVFYKDPRDPCAQLLECREGADVDKENLDSILKYLGATERRIHDNLTQDEIRNVMAQEARYVNNHADEFTWMAVFVMTHGRRRGCGQDLLYSSNGLPMDRKEVILNFIDQARMPNFAGRPRFFFFVACRSAEAVPTAPLPPELQEEIQSDGPGVYPAIREPHLVCSSTIDSHLSFRSTTEGTFYVQALCSQMRQYAAHLDILKIHTRVNQFMETVMSRKGGYYPSMSEMSNNNLSKEFYFDVQEDMQLN